MRFDIEFLRVISAFGIVWFHSGVIMGKSIAYSGLVFFIILSSYLVYSSNKSLLIKKRIERLLIPCLLWSFVYGFLNLLKGKGVFSEEYNAFSMLFSTPAIHLWYLPFIFICTLGIFFYKRHVLLSYQAFIATSLLFITLISSTYWQYISFISPIPQYFHGISAVLLGVILGVIKNKNVNERILWLLPVYITYLYLYLNGEEQFVIPYVIGTTVAIVLLKSKDLFNCNLNILVISNTTFGIYLSHIIFLYLMKTVGFDGFLLPLSAFITSLCFVYIVRKYFSEKLYKYIF